MADTKVGIRAKLENIKTSKEKMKRVIVAKGQEIADDDTFASYADKIRAIISGQSVEDLGSISITENGSTNPGANKGYSQVNVNVSAKVEPYGETVTKNGTIKASGDIDGYSSITVQVVDKDGNPIGGDGSPHGLGTKTFTKNGTYNAEDDGYKGYSMVKVAVVKEEEEEEHHDETFTVTFKNKNGETLQTVNNVPWGGAAAYTGEEPTSEDMDKIGYWYGWAPIPYDIKKNTECKAIYGDFNCGYKDPKEIKHNWDKICANHGEGYEIGQWRLLCLGETEYECTESDINNHAFGDLAPLANTSGLKTYYKDEDPHHLVKRFYMFRMMKVADALEDGSHSTWISIDYPNISVMEYYSEWAFSQAWRDSNGRWNRYNWERRLMRSFLNEYLLKAMPKCIQDSVVEVEKISSGLIVEGNRAGEWIPDIRTNDKIWTPSRREIFGDKTFSSFKYLTPYNDNGNPIYADYEVKPDETTGKFYETEGPTYASAFNESILKSMCERFGHKGENTETGIIRLRSIPYVNGDYPNGNVGWMCASIGYIPYYYSSSSSYYSYAPGYVKGVESKGNINAYGMYGTPAIGFCL